jgi:DNA invertase Pin-like site-specific DNA recombinase
MSAEFKAKKVLGPLVRSLGPSGRLLAVQSCGNDPALDTLLTDARRRRFDVVVVWRLDRLGRNLRHLITLLEELQALGIAFVSLGEGIDCTTAAGRLQLHVLAALAEFERARIAERVQAGLARVRASGTRLGRPAASVAATDLLRTAHLSVRNAAGVLGVSRSVVHRARLSQKPLEIWAEKDRDFLKDSGGRRVTAAVTQTVGSGTHAVIVSE